MNAKTLTTCFVVAALLSTLATRAADGDADRKNPVAFVKDSVITSKIKTKLAAEKMSSLAKISVDTGRDGMVFLCGTSNSRDAADKAASIARDPEGVAPARKVEQPTATSCPW